MEKKEKKILRHPFYDRHTIPGAIVLTIIGMLSCQTLFGGPIGMLFGSIVKSLGGTDVAVQIVTRLGVIPGTFLALAVFWRWFYPEYQGGFKGGQRVPFWSLICIAIVAGVLIMTMIIDKGRLGMPSAVNLAVAFVAGVSEEAVFRGMTASYLMRQWVEEKKILPVILVSSAIFGLIHGVNLVAGAPIIVTLFQIINAFTLGCFLCVVFIRSGSLIPVMIMHTLYDIVAFMDVSNLSDGGTYKETATFLVADKVAEGILGIIYIALTIYLTRPAVREKICEFWNKKWGKNGE